MMTNKLGSAPILVADDHLVNQMVLKALLKKLGYQADFVNDGREAIEAAAAHPYRIILMDLMMPVVDGIQAAKAIRKREFASGQHTPIIAVTAVSQADARERCIAAGMDDYMTKPIDREILQQKIEHWMNTAVAGRPDDVRVDKPGVSVEPIDTARLRLLYGKIDLDKILTVFLSITEALLSELEKAIGERNINVTLMAHEIKGSSYAVSAGEMAQLCLRLEHAGERQDWTEAMQIYAALKLAFLRVKEHLKRKTEIAALKQQS